MEPLTNLDSISFIKSKNDIDAISYIKKCNDVLEKNYLIDSKKQSLCDDDKLEQSIKTLKEKDLLNDINFCKEKCHKNFLLVKFP